MNILIIGEFSSFAKHLKAGFEALGHRVAITFNGDGWKKLKPDGLDILYGVKGYKIMGIPIRGLGLLAVPQENRRIQRSLDRIFPNGPDLIVCINYKFLSSNSFQAGVTIKYIKKCLARGAKLIMSECGASMAGNYFRKEWFDSHGYPNLKTKEKRYSFLLRSSDVIIPTVYHYYEQLMAYAEYHPFDVSKVTRSIPLPITIDNNAHINRIENRKVVVFHGVIRPIEKGTPFIKEAMDRLQAEMPERVECFCLGGMPYDEYVKLFDRVDILIDQAYFNGWGMNATIGAMKGKCVMVSCGPENAENMGIPEIPFVQIGPDSEQIYQTLKALVLNPERIDAIKEKSREFAVNHCETSHIAQRYLECVGLANKA